jgi:hypothetical protein
MFDLSTLAVNDTADVHIKAAGGALLYGEDKLPIVIGLFSPGTAEYAAAEDARTERAVERAKEKGNIPMSAKELRDEQIAFLVDCTSHHSNNFSHPAAADKTGKAFYRAVYSDRKIGFIFDQLNAKLGVWSTFTPGSSAA